MLTIGIIAPTKHLDWVANLVVVRKKMEKLDCVDLYNLNQLSLKNNYPLPNMKKLL